MKTKPTLAAFFAVSLSLPCFADTFTLKDGTTLEGSILSETPDAYTLEVQVTKSIKDERKVPKADVVKVSRAQPDLIAFEALGKLTPIPDLLTEEEYAVRIKTLEKFLKEHPSSSKAKEVQAVLSTLKAEVAEVSAGGVKFNGKIISAEEYKANAYDLDARVLEAKIRSLIDAGQLLLALREFVDFDRDFRTSLSYGTLSPLMKQVIQNQVAEASQQLSTLDARTKARDAKLQQMAPEDRRVTAAAIKEEADAIDARYKAEKEAKQVWPTMSPFHKQSLDDTVTFGKAELARLAAIKTVLGVDGGKAYRELYSVVHNDGNAAAVNAAAAAAKTAMVPDRYTAPLIAAANGRK
jgi:hypothetical protein